MTEIGSVYGNALYELAKEDGLTESIGQQLRLLQDSFRQEPDFIRLLSAPNLTKAERCQILDDSFRGKIEQYLLNFMKILTEKGYIRHFDSCAQAYTERYNQDNGILSVTAFSAIALNDDQTARLSEKLGRITGKKIALLNRVDPKVLGGIRLDYDGRRLDDTVSHRLDSIRDLLKTDVL